MAVLVTPIAWHMTAISNLDWLFGYFQVNSQSFFRKPTAK